jgi:hypothetical protein
MDPIVFLIILISSVLLALACAFFFFDWFGILKLRQSNSQRIQKFQRLANLSENFPKEKQASQVIFDKVNSLDSSWFLADTEWNVYENAHNLLSDIASSYHPNSQNPILEVRVGKLISGLKDLNKKILALLSRKGFRKMANFRLKHALSVQKVWKKKQEWESSWWGIFLKQTRFYFLAKWAYTVFRFFDISFWAIKTFTGLTHHFALKTLLINLYLELGEFALSTYREDNEKPFDLEMEDIEENLESSPVDIDWTQTKTPLDVKISLEPLRKDILYSKALMNWEAIKLIYWEEFETVADYYYPESENPIYEVKLYNSLAFASRLLEMASSLEKRPEIRKILNFRIAQAVELKERADSIMELPIIEWLRKYNMGKAAKVAKLAFQTIKNRHPGFILKDLLTTLLMEGVKRWFYIYLFDKIAEESCKLYDEIPEGSSNGKEITSSTSQQ